MPSEKGGGGTSSRSDPPAAGGAFGPSAAGRVNPDSNKMRRLLRTAQLHHSLYFAEPHGLEKLQTLPDDAGKIHRHGVAGLRIGGEVSVERFAGEYDHFG